MPSRGGHKEPGAALRRLRARIDALNLRLLKLLSERARAAAEVGRLKHSNGLEVYQPAREQQVIERVIADNPGPLGAEHIRRIFVEIISACRALEHVTRVAFLGPEHTYSHEAALGHFGASAELLPQPSIAAVFAALDNRRADYGLVPAENSTQGTIALTLDLLIDTPLLIVGEVLRPIRHMLLSRGGDGAAIRTIVAHQQALGQCRNFLAANFPHCATEEMGSNAFAAMRAAEDASCAAIASAAAGRAYGLKTLAENIQDNPNNATRFLVIGREPAPRTGRDKTTVLFAVPDQVGALNHALGLFARNRINISKIESRPLRLRQWEYLFFVDLEGHREDARLARALKGLEHRALFSKILGSYPEGRTAG